MRKLFFSAAMSLASGAAPSKWAPLIALTSSSFGVKSALGYAEHWHTDLQLSATPASLSHVEEKNNSTVSLTEEHSTEVCTPSAECELCPHGWRVSVERDDETIKGEFEACEKYERRQKHDCTLFYGELLVCLVMDSMWLVAGDSHSAVHLSSLLKHRCSFECDDLSADTGSTKKVTKNRSEYRPCQYTESDEQSRMVRLKEHLFQACNSARVSRLRG